MKDQSVAVFANGGEVDGEMYVVAFIKIEKMSNMFLLYVLCTKINHLCLLLA